MSSPPRYSEPLPALRIEERLKEFLDPVLSPRRTATTVAHRLAVLERPQQDFVLHWGGVIARTNAEMAYQFAATAPQALARMGGDTAAVEDWIVRAMDTYDRDGLYRGSAVLKDVDHFINTTRQEAEAATFEETGTVLELFVCGLAGRRLKIESGADIYTDTETIHLPPQIAAFGSKDKNFAAYKAIAAHLWAQTRYGTFSRDLDSVAAAYDDPAHALAWLNFLETLRLDARIAHLLPGLAREMAQLRDTSPLTAAARLQRLFAADAGIDDSIALLPEYYSQPLPAPYPYMGVLHPGQAQAVRQARLTHEKNALKSMLADVLEEHQRNDRRPMDTRPDEPRFAAKQAASDSPARPHFNLELDGQPVTLPPQANDMLQSIAQDLGEIPDDYLVPAGPGERQSQAAARAPADNVWNGVRHEEDTFLYNEWDFRRKHYRKHWCVLRERDVAPGAADFVPATLAKYAVQVTQLRRTFELLRGESRLLKRQKNGPEIDLDAAVEGFVDLRCGEELPEHLHARHQKTDRDLAVMFMVDMSGSTKGWINDAEREALVMLCQALEVLGDRYAIYGFSGMTRRRCEIFRIKRFDDPYDDIVMRRIAGILPQDYTRMGAAIRHLTTLLNAAQARTKVLITLSDGKPDDYSDNYRGDYGIEDTRQALIEAHRSDIKPFCITIDREARDYLPRMYGPVNYAVVDNISRLPLKVADVYRKLTT
ncbi:MAG TPA: VWA domain-containing protein [Burkholderiales bacterium]|nr:VWA domain-containing protein [Burkholderiales bacterium]